MSEKRFPPFDDREQAAGFRFLREHPTYGSLVPPKRTLKIDWYLLRAIGNEIARRRTPQMKLALLTGTVVREFIPDVSRDTRHLGEAYRDAVMHMFRRRQTFKRSRKANVGKAEEHPVDAPEQFRLV